MRRKIAQFLKRYRPSYETNDRLSRLGIIKNIIIVYHMSKKPEARFNILSRDMEDYKRLRLNFEI